MATIDPNQFLEDSVLESCVSLISARSTSVFCHYIARNICVKQLNSAASDPLATEADFPNISGGKNTRLTCGVYLRKVGSIVLLNLCVKTRKSFRRAT